MKKFIPASWKLRYRRLQRSVDDRRSGLYYRLPKKEINGEDLPIQFSITQRIMPGKNLANKVQNIHLAASKIQDVQIAPGEVFSFWHFVENPSKKNGFQASRNLVNGQLVPGYGGGLCQLSGIIYHLALKAEMPIIERHPHSVDIYEEHERFTPPGSDATVVFGRKDLRFENHFDFPVSFRFRIEPAELTAHVCSAKNIQPTDIQFIVNEKEAKIQVKVMKLKAGELEMIREESYPKLKTTTAPN